MSATGKVYIASMKMRGAWAPVPENCLRINVTSAQSKSSAYRLAFSPMTQTGYKGFLCFENYWQSAKRYEGLTSEKDLYVQDKWYLIMSPEGQTIIDYICSINHLLS